MADVLRNRPRSLGAALLPLSVILAIGADAWLRQVTGGAVTHPAAQARLSLVAWLGSCLVGAWLLWRGTSAPAAFGTLRESFSSVGVAGRSRVMIRFASWSITALLVAIGLSEQVEIARANTDPQYLLSRPRPDVHAGIWLRQHTDPNAIVMARQLPTTYHYSDRHEVWFPPSTNAALLMDGIRRLKVDYVVVVHRENSYYLPPDDSCFDQLLRAYPSNFRLVFENPEFRVFKTIGGAEETPPSSSSE